MKSVLRVKNIARAFKLRKSIGSPDEDNAQQEVKQVFIQKKIEDVQVCVYVVEDGDTIASIAQEFNMSITDIVFINQLYSGQFLYIGQALYVYMNPNDSAANPEYEGKPLGRSLFPNTDESVLGLLSSYKLLISSLRANRDFSMCKEAQVVPSATVERPPTALQLATRLGRIGLLDEFRVPVVYSHKGREYSGVLSGSPTLVVFEANWENPIIENDLMDYLLEIKTSDVLVCHLFEDTKEEISSSEVEDPELQFGFSEEVGSNAGNATTSAGSYLQLTVVKPGSDPRVIRFKGESGRIHVSYKKLMAWTGKPVNPLGNSLSSSSYFMRDMSPFPTPPASTQTSARTSPIMRVASGFAPIVSKETSSTTLDSLLSPPLPPRLLAQHQPDQSVLKEPAVYITKNGKVAGILTVTSSMAIFEPDLKDPAVVAYGLIANQVNLFMTDVYDCIVVGEENADKTSIQIVTRDGNSEKTVIFETDTEKATQLATNLKQQMAGRPKPTTRPVSVPASPTQPVPSSNTPPGSSLPSSPSSFISSLRTSTIGRFGALSPRGSSGETTPIEDEFEPGSPGLQSDMIKDIESFVPALQGVSQILTMEWIQFIRRYVSARDVYKNWALLYSTEKHGISINTMYAKVHEKGAMVIVVEDSKGYVFGGYASEYFRPSQRYYGTGESFLFRLHPQIDVYPWPNSNNFFIFSSEHFISMGGGDSGKYGLYLDADFATGTSGYSNTYHNKPLASSEFFECALMEIWGFVDTE